MCGLEGDLASRCEKYRSCRRPINHCVPVIPPGCAILMSRLHENRPRKTGMQSWSSESNIWSRLQTNEKRVQYVGWNGWQSILVMPFSSKHVLRKDMLQHHQSAYVIDLHSDLRVYQHSDCTRIHTHTRYTLNAPTHLTFLFGDYERET